MIALLLGFVIAACVIEVCLIKTIPQRSTSVLTAHYKYICSTYINDILVKCLDISVWWPTFKFKF